MNIKEVIGRGERAEGALAAAKFSLLLPQNLSVDMNLQRRLQISL